MTGTADFWSRRKAQVKAEQDADLKAARREDTERAVEAKTDAELLQDLDLPDPDTLSAGDDFRAFMNHAVPDRLRRRALRRLWASNPALANLDALVDYGEDYTDAATVVANLQTAYQVGKGIVRKIEETANADTAPEADMAEAIEPPAAEEANVDSDPPADAAPIETEQATTQPTEAQDTAPPRRMRFAFAADGPIEETS